MKAGFERQVANITFFLETLKNPAQVFPFVFFLRNTTVAFDKAIDCFPVGSAGPKKQSKKSKTDKFQPL